MLGEPVDDQLVPSALPGGAVIPYRSPRLDPLLERGAGWCVVVGIAALADGSYLLAFTQLRQLFGENGAPVHNIFSYLGVADMAAAAVRADRRMEGHDVLERALSHLGGTASPRLEQLIARAPGILAGPDRAGGPFEKGLPSPPRGPGA